MWYSRPSLSLCFSSDVFIVSYRNTHHLKGEEYNSIKIILLLDHQYVTCGSVIKLKHVETQARLHSHEITYPFHHCFSFVT